MLKVETGHIWGKVYGGREFNLQCQMTTPGKRKREKKNKNNGGIAEHLALEEEES